MIIIDSAQTGVVDVTDGSLYTDWLILWYIIIIHSNCYNYTHCPIGSLTLIVHKLELLMLLVVGCIDHELVC